MPDLFESLAAVYNQIGREYDETALFYDNFSCTGCSDNCCTTVFSHYTLIEHLFFMQGLAALPEERRSEALSRAGDYIGSIEKSDLPAGELSLMCPVNFDGLCGVYGHRPLICRIHGIPAQLVSPSKGTQKWAGCLRFQERHGKNISREMDRTRHYALIAGLEAELRKRVGFFDKYRKTIAEMVLDSADAGSLANRLRREMP